MEIKKEKKKIYLKKIQKSLSKVYENKKDIIKDFKRKIKF